MRDRASGSAASAPSDTSSVIRAIARGGGGHLLRLRHDQTRIERRTRGAPARPFGLRRAMTAPLGCWPLTQRPGSSKRQHFRQIRARGSAGRRCWRPLRDSGRSGRVSADPGGWIDAGSSDRNSRAASTIRPTLRPPACDDQQPRATGRTAPARTRTARAGSAPAPPAPREKTTPSTKRAALGTAVTCSIISTCATSRLRSA